VPFAADQAQACASINHGLLVARHS
jgi:hypothetical protein